MKTGTLFDQSRLFLPVLEKGRLTISVAVWEFIYIYIHTHKLLMYIGTQTHLEAKDEKNCTVQTLRLGNLSREVSI